MVFIDHYEILGIAEIDTEKEIKTPAMLSIIYK
ncbi:MAG: hypothetical protein ACJASM_001824 [Salibacteraceae bacterium]|jgi:hypothetical protein